MTPQQVSKVWSIIGLFLLYYVLNTWIVTQGGQEIFGAKLIVPDRIPAAMWGIPIASILIGLNAWVGLHYARRTGPLWHHRVPIVGFENIDTASFEGRVYQRAMFGLLSVLPLAGLLHFWRLFSNAEVVTTGSSPKPLNGIWDWSGLISLDDPARICTQVIADGAQVSCEKNATILPGLEPSIFALLSGVAVVLSVVHWLAIFRRR